MAILREGKHAHFELVLSQNHQFKFKSDNPNGFDDLNKWRYNRSFVKPPWGERSLFTDSPFTISWGGGGGVYWGGGGGGGGWAYGDRGEGLMEDYGTDSPFKASLPL